MPTSTSFHSTIPTSTLVLVDMCKPNLPRGLKRSPGGTILQNCRRALAFARIHGWCVAHVRSEGSLFPGSEQSIAGFEPERIDPQFERKALSCYSSPYFQSVIQETGGSYVLAGFLGNGGGLSTIADSLLYGDNITLLSDASIDEASRHAFSEPILNLLTAHTNLRFNVVSTSAWLRALDAIYPFTRNYRAEKRADRRPRRSASGASH
jgi:nicotinamidase-related amidase